MLEGELEGLEDAIKCIRALRDEYPEDATKGLRKALRDGAKLARDQMLNDAPVRSGQTRNAIKVRAGKRRRGRISMMVTIGRAMFQGDTFYAGFVNYGWKWAPNKRQKKAGKTAAAGREIPGTHWLEKSWERVKQPVVQRVLDSFTAYVKALRSKTL